LTLLHCADLYFHFLFFLLFKSKRIYIDVPNQKAISVLIKKYLQGVDFAITDSELFTFAAKLEGYSCSDIKSLAKEASMYPLKAFDSKLLVSVDKKLIRAVNLDDFEQARHKVLPSLTQKDIDVYAKWEKKLSKSMP